MTALILDSDTTLAVKHRRVMTARHPIVPAAGSVRGVTMVSDGAAAAARDANAAGLRYVSSDAPGIVRRRR